MIGFASLVTARYGAQLPQEALGWMSQIERAGERMNQMIEDLLRLAHLGKQTLQLAPVDLKEMVLAIAEDLQLTQPERLVAFQLEPLPLVMGDRGLLQQVFANLLSNAFKFTGSAIKATITVGCEVQQGERVLFVRDNGAGFDMAQARRLFTAFERLHTKDEFEGTGVGLSIVQRIVERHGGRIWAVGETGKGASFYLTLSWI